MASSRQIAPDSSHDHETDRRERARGGGAGAEGRKRSGGGGAFGADDWVVGVELAGTVFDLGAQGGVAAGGLLDLGGVGPLSSSMEMTEADRSVQVTVRSGASRPRAPQVAHSTSVVRRTTMSRWHIGQSPGGPR